VDWCPNMPPGMTAAARSRRARSWLLARVMVGHSRVWRFWDLTLVQPGRNRDAASIPTHI